MFTPTFGTGFSRTEQDRTGRHGGGVKLLLRCLQSIQCQYYLVFGVVKTVPLQSFARLRASPASSPPPLLSLLQKMPPRHFFPRFKRLNNNMANGHRYIYIYILHLLSLRSFLITYNRAHILPWFAFFSLFFLTFFFYYKESDKSTS